MSRVQSRHIAAPLPRAWLDSAASPIRALFGILFIVWSWASTIIIVGYLLEPLLGNQSALGIIADRYALGLLLSFFVSAVEFVSAGRWPAIYWPVMLLLDAGPTAWQTHSWAITIVAARVAITPAGSAGIWAASIVGGIIAAVFGEILLFGARRY